ncbi:hypothetical protein C8F04DRAFT_1190455 [Mycena alexandri]|uniref:Uncharacterized protein n=1 Tax=Mycena alexandri TaxID=1745969 RepID=A0AAD6SFZ8_9AGAR|nr:hypothetical protein C8F04DRAFT_1190455 [Mycena alexandri]
MTFGNDGSGVWEFTGYRSSHVAEYALKRPEGDELKAVNQTECCHREPALRMIRTNRQHRARLVGLVVCSQDTAAHMARQSGLRGPTTNFEIRDDDGSGKAQLELNTLTAVSEILVRALLRWLQPLANKSRPMNHTLGLTAVPYGGRDSNKTRHNTGQHGTHPPSLDNAELAVVTTSCLEHLRPGRSRVSQYAVKRCLASPWDSGVGSIHGIAAFLRRIRRRHRNQFRCESLHPDHHGIVQHPVQYHLAFNFGGNVECIGGIAFRAESLHPGHHSIVQHPVQYPLTFSFGANGECAGGIALSAFRPESLHPGHHSIVQHPVQYPLTFSFGGNGQCTGGIAFRPESLYPGHHIVAQHLVQQPLTFSFGGNVECIGGIAPNPSIEVTETLPSTKYNAPSQPIGIMTPGASTAVRLQTYVLGVCGTHAAPYVYVCSPLPHNGAPSMPWSPY